MCLCVLALHPLLLLGKISVQIVSRVFRSVYLLSFGFVSRRALALALVSHRPRLFRMSHDACRHSRARYSSQMSEHTQITNTEPRPRYIKYMLQEPRRLGYLYTRRGSSSTHTQAQNFGTELLALSRLPHLLANRTQCPLTSHPRSRIGSSIPGITRSDACHAWAPQSPDISR